MEVAEFPNYPTLACSICKEQFEVPRGWVKLPGFGAQILANWDAADDLMKFHHKTHVDDLVTGVEEHLRANARSRGA